MGSEMCIRDSKKRAHINVSSQNPKVDFIFSYVNYALTINCPPSVTVAADKSIPSTDVPDITPNTL